jgi:hypothetical protein
MRYRSPLGLCFLVTLCCALQLHAQGTAVHPKIDEIRRGTAAERRNDLQLYRRALKDAVLPRDAVYPKDSMIAAFVARAGQWSDSLAAHAPRGIQLDPWGSIAAQSSRTELGQRLFSNRLTSEILSLQDRANTYLIAVETFTDDDHPEQFPLAERYAAKLDALGPDAAFWQLLAYRTLILAYDKAGDRAKAAAHVTTLVTLVPKISVEFRRMVYDAGFLFSMLTVVREMPDGPAQVHRVVQQLRAATTVPAERIAMLPTLAFAPAQWKDQLDRAVQVVSDLETPAPAVTGNYWCDVDDARRVSSSQASPGVVPLVSRTQRFDDGRVHVVSMALSTHPFALSSLPALERLHVRFKEAVGVTIVPSLEGSWGVDQVTPVEEARRYCTIMRHRLGLTVPIVFSIAPKEPTIDGGMLPPRDPNWIAYHRTSLISPIVTFVIDARGVRRRIFMSLDRESEAELVAYVASLTQARSDAGRASSPASLQH